MRNRRKNLTYKLISLASLVTVILIWWLVADVFNVVADNIFPGPFKVFSTFIRKFYETAPDGSTMLQHLYSSLQVALTGYLIGVVIGNALGIIMAWSKIVDMFVRPLFDFIRSISGIAWIPVMIVLFGIGLVSKSMVIFISCFTSCVVNSYTGIKQTKDVHLWVAQTFGASNIQTLFKIAIPTALPMIMTGLRVGLGYSWSALVAAELLASTRGLGFMIQQCRGLYRPDVIIAGMIAIGAVGAFLTYLLSLLEKAVVKGDKNR